MPSQLTISTVAAGFDAARGDQLGGCFVTPECYAHMTHMLMSLAGGKIVACLEVGESTIPNCSMLTEFLRVDITSTQ